MSFSEACAALPTTFGAIFTAEGLPSLFADLSKFPLVLVTIFAFSISDTFDTLGTFIGTGRRSGIFSEEDERAMETSAGFKSKMGQGAVRGCDRHFHRFDLRNIEHDDLCGECFRYRRRRADRSYQCCGRHLFCHQRFSCHLCQRDPVCGNRSGSRCGRIMMTSAFKEIQWDDFSEAVPAFFAGTVHGSLLQHFLRYRFWIYFLLHRKDL